MWSEAEKFLLKDKYIGPLIKKYGPCNIKPRKKSEYFESLVREIISQQLSGKAASTIYGRFKENVVDVTPENILKKRDLTLRNCGMSYAKVSYVKDLARRVRDGELKLDNLNKLKDEKVIEELIRVKGIGKWTAEMFLMFSLARPDVFPVDDLGIRKGIQKMYNKDLTHDEIGVIATRWKPYRTVTSWYTWKLLDS